MAKLELEALWTKQDTETSDGGQSKSFQIDDDYHVDNGMFVRIQSWDSTKVHEKFSQFEGKTVRVTIETLD